MNDDYFDSQVVNLQTVMGIRDRPVIDKQVDWSEVSGQSMVRGQSKVRGSEVG